MPLEEGFDIHRVHAVMSVFICIGKFGLTITDSTYDDTMKRKTYQYSKAVPAFSGYSDIDLMPDGHVVAVLYE